VGSHVDELNIILLPFPFIFSHADFIPPSEGGNGMSVGAVVGIVAAIALTIILLLSILWWRGCLRCKDTMDEGTLKLTIVNKWKLFIAIFMFSKLRHVSLFARLFWKIKSRQFSNFLFIKLSYTIISFSAKNII